MTNISEKLYFLEYFVETPILIGVSRQLQQRVYDVVDAFAAMLAFFGIRCAFLLLDFLV